MQFRKSFFAWGLFTACSAGVPLFSQDGDAAGKAQRYEEMLAKRPQFGVLYDRYVQSWLESGTMDSLVEHLRVKAARPDASGSDWILLALFLTQQGEESEAIRAYEEGLKRDPHQAAAWLEKARLEARLLNFEAALKSLESATASTSADDKSAVEIAKLRGRLLLRMGKVDEALNVWRELMASNPQDEDLTEEVIDLQLDEGLYSEAVDVMLALIARTKDNYAKVSRRLRLVDVYRRAGKRSEARKELEACLQQAGQDTWIEGETLDQMQRGFRTEDDITGLMAYLVDLAKKYPQRMAVQEALARVQMEAGEGESAMQSYHDMLSRTPGRKDLREGYLSLLERLGKYPEAIKQTQILVDQAPDDGELLLRLAALQQSSGDSKTATATLELYLGRKGITEHEHLRVARLLESWSRKEDAAAEYQKMLTLYPQSEAVREAQAQFLYRIEKRSEAVAIWREMAAKGNLDQVVATTQILLARQEAKVALESLKARLDEFRTEPRFLTLLTSAAVSAGESKQAVGLVKSRVTLTIDTTLLDDAIRQAVDVLKTSDAVVATIRELEVQAVLSPSERSLLAALLEESGDRQQAEEALRRMPPDTGLLGQTRLVRLMETRQDWPRAVQEMEKLVAMEGGRTSQNVQRLVDLHQRAGDPKEALRWATEWKVLSPSSIPAWITESRLQAQQGNQVESLKTLRGASRKFPEDYGVATALAEAYAYAGQFADAEVIYFTQFEKAATLDEKLRWVGSLTQVARQRGLIQRVIERFQERQRKNREDVAPWLALAEIYRVAERPAEQRRALTEAIRLQPRNLKLLHTIARLDEEVGQWKEALVTLQRAAPLDTTPNTRHMIAMLELRTGDVKMAFQLLSESMGGDTMAVKDVLRLADIMLAQQEWEQAAKFLASKSQIYPDDYRLRYLRTEALIQDNRYDEATQELLQIITTDQELPERIKAVQGGYLVLATGVEQYRKDYPPGMFELNAVQNAAYSVIQQRMYGQQSQSRGRAVVNIPTSLDQTRVSALVSLISIQDELSSALREALPAKLKSAGVGYVDTILKLRQDSTNIWMLRYPLDTLKGTDEDLLPLAYAISQAALNNQVESLSIETLQRALTLFKGRYPILEIQTVMLLAKSGSDNAFPALSSACDAMEARMKENPAYIESILVTLTSSLGGGQRVRNDIRLDLPTDLRRRLIKLVMDGVLIPAKKSGRLPYYYQMMMTTNAIRAQGEWEFFITLWNEYLDIYDRSNRIAQRQSRQATVGAHGQPILKPLGFPPAGGSLPEFMVLMMRHVDPINPGMFGDADGPEDEYAPVAALLDRVKHPDLRLVLAWKSNQQADVEKGLEVRLSKPQPSVNDLVMAAGYAGYKGDTEKALSLFVKLESMSLEADVREMVDAALVHAVVNMKTRPTPEALTAAQNAARRMRSGKLSNEHKEELVQAFIKLNLKDDAEQWKRLITPNPVGSGNRTLVRNSPAQDATTRVEKLVDQGDHDRAVAVVLTELKTLLAQNGSNRSYVTHMTDQLLKKLSFPQSREKLLKALEPSDGATLGRRLQYGALLAVIKENDRAIKVYEEIIAQHPQHTEAMAELISLIALKDPQRSSEMLSSVPWQTFARGFGDRLAGMLRSSDAISFEGRMALFTALTRFFEETAVSNDVPPRGALDWAYQLADAAASYSNEVRLPNLYQEDVLPGNSYYRNTDQKLVERRRRVHDDLCRAMSKHPSIAEYGFRGLSGLAIHENVDLKEVTLLARNILKQQTEARKQGKTFSGAVLQQSRYGRSEGEFARPNPLEFLMRQAVLSDRPSVALAALEPVITAALRPDEAKEQLALLNLWGAEPDHFLAAAESYRKTMKPGLSNFDGWASGWPEVIACAIARRLDLAILEDSLLNEVRRIAEQGSSHAPWLKKYIQARLKALSTQDGSEFLKRVAQCVMGSEEKWPAKITNYLNYRFGRNSGRTSGYDDGVYQMCAWAGALLSQKETMPAAFEFVFTLGLAKDPQWIMNHMVTLLVSHEADPELAVLLLQRAPFLGREADFDPWAQQADVVSKRAGHAGVLSAFFEGVKQNQSVRHRVQEYLNTVQPRTFGVQICRAWLDDHAQPELRQYLKTHGKEIAQIPASRKEPVLAVLEKTLPKLLQWTDEDAALREALDPLLASKKLADEATTKSWEEATTFDALNVKMDSFEKEMQRQVAKLVTADPVRAEKLFLHLTGLMEAKERTTKWEGRGAGNGWLIRSEMMQEINLQTPHLKGMVFGMKLMSSDDSGYLTHSGWSNKHGWGQAMLDLWKAGGGAGDTTEAVRHMIRRISEEMKDQNKALLALAFYDFFNKLHRQHREHVYQAALSMDADPLTDAVRQEFVTAARFFFLTDNASRSDERWVKLLDAAGGWSSVWAHYRAVVQDESLSPRVRIALAHHVLYRGKLSPDPELARTAAALALKAQRERWCLHGFQYYWIMRAWNTLPVDDVWKAAAQEHWDAWTARLAFQPSSRSDSLIYKPCDEAIHGILRMAGRLGQQEWIGQIMTRHHETLHNKPSALAILLETDCVPQAVAWFDRAHATLLYDYQGEISWNTKLAEMQPKLRAAITDPGKALLAELTLVSIPDPAKPEQQAMSGFQDRSARLMRIAERLADTTFSDEATKIFCLQRLSELPGTYPLLAKTYDEAAAKIDFGKVAAKVSTKNYELELRPVVASLSLKAWKGDYKAALEASDRIAEILPQGAYYRQYLISYLIAPFLRAQIWEQGQRDGLSVEGLISFLDHFLQDTAQKPKWPISVSGECLEAKVLLSVASGKTGDLASWWTKLEQGRKNAMEKNFSSRDDVWSLAKVYAAEAPNKKPVEARIRLVVGMLEGEIYQKRYLTVNSAHLPNDLVRKARLFSPEEWAQAAPQVAKVFPRDGRTASEAAEILAQEGLEEEALKLYTLAMEHALNKPNERVNYALRMTEGLARMNRKGEAVALLKGVSLDKLSEVSRKNIGAAVERLSR